MANKLQPTQCPRGEQVLKVIFVQQITYYSTLEKSCFVEAFFFYNCLLCSKCNVLGFLDKVDILSTGPNTLTQDERFTVRHTAGDNDWTLAIKFVNQRDQGVYVCQVSNKC